MFLEEKDVKYVLVIIGIVLAIHYISQLLN